jgi:carboxyl-terminal processing protease
MKDNKDKTLQSLNLEKYRAEQKLKVSEMKKFDKIGKRISDLQFNVTVADSSAVYSDSTKTARFKGWLKDLKNDIYVDEVFKITEKIEK